MYLVFLFYSPVLEINCLKLCHDSFFKVQLTQHQSGVLRDFEFLVQSFWLEVVEKFEENLSFIFSAGDPEKFHSHYTTMFAWLDDFERRLGDVKAIEKFRSNPSYSGFVSRWNLSIYFQIRQQVRYTLGLIHTRLFDGQYCDKKILR